MRADPKAQTGASLTGKSPLKTGSDAQAGLCAQAGLGAEPEPETGTGLRTEPGLNTGPEAQADLAGKPNLAAEVSGCLRVGKARNNSADTGLPPEATLVPQPSSQTACQPAGQACPNVGRNDIRHRGTDVCTGKARISRNDSRVTHDRGSVLSNDSTRILSNVARRGAHLRGRRKPVLVRHRLLQSPNRVPSTKVEKWQRIGRGRRDLHRRHVDQSGVGHGLPGRCDERPCRVFAAKQAQDVVDKRGHLHCPFNRMCEVVRRNDRRSAINAMDLALPRNRGQIPQTNEYPPRSTGSPH
ncbi:hypothetical protein NJB1728f10_10290 [Mycobacterium marinum]|nr:hypothetical protein NJB1728f10_10290 [Mycobacterium marinum]